MTMLFFNIAWMEKYQGVTEDDKPSDGGTWKVKHEVCNFAPIEGRCYGYGQAGDEEINFEAWGQDKAEPYIDSVTLVWRAKKPTGGSVMIGYYKNARVYRQRQGLPTSPIHQSNNLSDYWVECQKDDAVCLPTQKRSLPIEGFGRSNIWYGKTAVGPETIKQVKDFIAKYEAEKTQTDGYETAIGSGAATAGSFDDHQKAIEQDVRDILDSDLPETEKTRQVQARLGQGRFRDEVLRLSGNACSVTGCAIKEMLRASHIKPWALCHNAGERLSPDNGLMLTASLDALFDRGLISFSDDGKMLDKLNLPDYQRKEYHIGKPLLKRPDDRRKPFLQFHRSKYGFE